MSGHNGEINALSALFYVLYLRITNSFYLSRQINGASCVEQEPQCIGIAIFLFLFIVLQLRVIWVSC
jgi:hypothetical protein